jgi:hypothetical protein
LASEKEKQATHQAIPHVGVGTHACSRERSRQHRSDTHRRTLVHSDLRQSAGQLTAAHATLYFSDATWCTPPQRVALCCNVLHSAAQHGALCCHVSRLVATLVGAHARSWSVCTADRAADTTPQAPNRWQPRCRPHRAPTGVRSAGEACQVAQRPVEARREGRCPQPYARRRPADRPAPICRGRRRAAHVSDAAADGVSGRPWGPRRRHAHARTGTAQRLPAPLRCAALSPCAAGAKAQSHRRCGSAPGGIGMGSSHGCACVRSFVPQARLKEKREARIDEREQV